MKCRDLIYSIVLLLVVLCTGSVVHAQNKIRWMTMEEALKKSEVKPRKIFIDVYTKWCGWCKKMEETTLAEDKIAKYINENFYAVKLDAECKKDIVFDGRTYSYVKSYPKGYHELAYELLGGKLKLPSIIIIDEDLKVLQSIDGFMNCGELDMVTQYYASNSYKTINWRAFIKTYESGILTGNKDE